MAWSVIRDIAQVDVTVFSRVAGEWKYSPRVQCRKIIHDKPLDNFFILYNTTMTFRCHLAVVHHSHRP